MVSGFICLCSGTWCSSLNSFRPCFMEKVLQKHEVSTYQLGTLMVLTPLPWNLTHTTCFVCNKEFWHFWRTQLCRWHIGFLLIEHWSCWKSSKESWALFPVWKGEAFESQTHQCAPCNFSVVVLQSHGARTACPVGNWNPSMTDWTTLKK